MKEILIRQLPVLGTLPDEELARLTALIQMRTFPKGAILYREGESGDVFHIILKGKAEILRAFGTEDERRVGINGHGDLVGEMSVLSDDQKRTATVRAMEELDTLEVPLTEFNALLRKYPAVGAELVRTFSRRLDEVNDAAIRDLHTQNRRLQAGGRQLARTRLAALGLLALLLGVSVFAGSLAFFLLSARTALDTPSELALLMADTGRGFIIPGDAAARTNPVPANPDTLAAGRRVYAARCVVCHGADGKGQTPIGMHTYPRASNLTAAKTQARADGVLFWIVENGSPHTGMPGWKGTLKDDEIWQAIGYVRQLPKGEAEIAKLLPTPTASPTPPPAPTAVPGATAAPTVQAARTVTVTILSYEFTPPTLTVPAGTTVVWVNKDGDDHNVVSEDSPPLFDSPLFGLGKSWSFTFTRAGTYKYTCTPHDEMHGVIVVN